MAYRVVRNRVVRLVLGAACRMGEEAFGLVDLHHDESAFVLAQTAGGNEPGKNGGGGGIAPGGTMAGLGTAWPSAAYEDVIESMTDCAFSCPISVRALIHHFDRAGWMEFGAARTLVVLHDVPQMVSARIMRLAHAHRVVREVDIAVVACIDRLVDVSRRGLRVVKRSRRELGLGRKIDTYRRVLGMSVEFLAFSMGYLYLGILLTSQRELLLDEADSIPVALEAQFVFMWGSSGRKQVVRNVNSDQSCIWLGLVGSKRDREGRI